MPNTKIFVAQLPQFMPNNVRAVETLAIVVDTLRFTTTACHAIASGAHSIAIAAEIDDARLAAKEIGASALLCGERQCRKIPGFHLGNSPLEYTPEAVAGRDLVFSTTNGTRAVLAAEHASVVALGRLINREAIPERALQWMGQDSSRQVAIVCAGTDRELSTEDEFTAGAIVEKMLAAPGTSPASASSAALAALNCWRRLREGAIEGGCPLSTAICACFEGTEGGKNLVAAGFQGDLEAAAKLDSSTIIPARVTRGGARFQGVDQFSSQ